MSDLDARLADIDARFRREGRDNTLQIAMMAASSLDLADPELSDDRILWAIEKAHRVWALAAMDYRRRSQS